MQLFYFLIFGFLLGLRHATDADHIAAITTIVSREKNNRNIPIIGTLWGIGHSISVTIIAIPVVLFSISIPLQFSLWLEFIVGIMLVTLGGTTLIGLSNRFNPKIHSHVHENGKGTKHTHQHIHFLGNFFGQTHHLGIFHTVRPLLIGIIHGLAGSAAITILVLTTIKDPMVAILYIFIFNIGIIFGMMLVTTAFGASLLLLKNKSNLLHRYLVLISGVFSLFFGVYIIYKTGLELFSLI